jgi:hypothetical protein
MGPVDLGLMAEVSGIEDHRAGLTGGVVVATAGRGLRASARALAHGARNGADLVPADANVGEHVIAQPAEFGHGVTVATMLLVARQKAAQQRAQPRQPRLNFGIRSSRSGR